MLNKIKEKLSGDIMEKGHFISSDGKSEIAYYIYNDIAQTKPKAVLQISHGMQDYIFRYGDLIKFLNKNGIVVCGNDDLGHGYTSYNKQLDGYFAKKNGYKFVVKDLYTMTKIAKDKYKDVPYFLLGHSMGSFFARYYAYLYPNELSGLILCGTSGKVFGTSFGIALLSLVKMFKGEKSYCKTMENMMLKKYFKYIKTIKTKREWVTSDEQKLSEYENDERCNFRFTASAYKDMLTVLKFVNTKKWAKGINKQMPIAIYSGSLDPVGNYGKSVCEVYKLLEKQKISSLKLKLFEGAYHELHNEKNEIKQEFFNDLIVWLNNKIKV